jgi:hypothetical protein
MAKTRANYPASLDVLDTDRQAGQIITSESYDILEDAITQIEAELRRVTSKTEAGTLAVAEGGLIKVSAAVSYTLYLPTAVGNIGLRYFFIKTDDNSNLITVDANGAETINGALTYAELNYQYAHVTIISDNLNWHIIEESTIKGGTF